jgi:hypothetical protein
LAQVGSSCVADFIASAAESRRPRALRRRIRRTDRPGATAVVEYVDTGAFLAHVAQAVFDSGWVSAASATRREPATWRTAATLLDLGRPPSARAGRRARQAVAWARQELSARECLTDFEQHLVDVVGRDRLTRRELPTAAALIHAFHCELRDRINIRQKLGKR